ncbi:sensor domain-containing protein [Catenulispora sp. NL8]|uniref:Sensor domain-containing protein n=1 Tax=Catenulispora pinistramenti TaxID=2705254 RepID=A0ABS5KK17_9ACTN|nr:sensor domain-containing protein [Catenulispora pinistramenti]
MLTAMPFGTKGVSIAVFAAIVLSMAACSTGGSAKAAKPSASTRTGAVSSTSASPSTSAQAASSGSASGSTLTTDVISKQILLTGKDEAGYTFDPSQDSKATTNVQDVVATGGSACQVFVDAQEALVPKYGTTAEVDRELTKAGDGHSIEDSVMTFPSAAKASALITDLAAGLKGCQSLSVPQQGGGSVTMSPSAIPELAKAGQAGYIDYLTADGKAELMAAELVAVGTAVSVVAIIGPVSTDPTVLKQMGGTLLSHLSDVQAGRLKSAQGAS